MGLSSKQILKLIKEYEVLLKNAKKVAISFDRKWDSQFPNQAGLYVIYDREEVVYFGETGNIKGRMKDLRRTVNHSFRRSLGFKLFGEKATSSRKFSDSTEVKLNHYFIDNIALGWLEIPYGRLEMEEYLVDKYAKKILNKKKKRS